MSMITKNQRKRPAVITGVGSGLGRDIALGLAAKVYRVFGTAMSSEEIADLRKASDGAVNLSQCDITNEAAVKKVMTQSLNDSTLPLGIASRLKKREERELAQCSA